MSSADSEIWEDKSQDFDYLSEQEVWIDNERSLDWFYYLSNLRVDDGYFVSFSETDDKSWSSGTAMKIYNYAQDKLKPICLVEFDKELKIPAGFCDNLNDEKFDLYLKSDDDQWVTNFAILLAVFNSITYILSPNVALLVQKPTKAYWTPMWRLTTYTKIYYFVVFVTWDCPAMAFLMYVTVHFDPNYREFLAASFTAMLMFYDISSMFLVLYRKRRPFSVFN